MNKRALGVDDDYDNWLEENLTTGGTTIAQKYQDRQRKSPSNNANDIDPEKIIESKLCIIAKLQKYKMGDNDKLEAIKKSLIDEDLLLKRVMIILKKNMENIRK